MQPSPKRPIVNEDYRAFLLVQPNAKMLEILNNPQPVKINLAPTEEVQDPEAKVEVDKDPSASADKVDEEKKEEAVVVDEP